MSAYRDVDVVAAGLAVGVGAACVTGAHLNRAQCAAVAALGARLELAERLLAIAVDALVSDYPELRDWARQELVDFKLEGEALR